MQKRKTKRLPQRELADIRLFMAEKMATAMGDALQLVEDPIQRVEVVTGVTLAMFRMTVDEGIAAHFRVKGKKLPREEVIRNLALTCAQSVRRR